MSIRSVGMAAPFRWLMKSLDIGRRQPGALFGGFALLLVVGLIPSLVQMAIQLGLQPSPPVMVTVYVVVMLVSLVIMPPLMAGGFRLIHACETSQTARATDVFSIYRDPPTAVRLVLTALVLMVIYLAVFVGLILMPGGTFFGELMQVAMTTPPGQQPDVTGLEPPPGLLLWLLFALFSVVVVGNAYMLAFAQGSLTSRGPLAATRDGFVATFKNLLPLIGFAIVVGIVGFVLSFIVLLVLMLVLGLLAMASPALGIAIAIPVYLAVVLVFYVVAFAFYYHAWREIFDEPIAPAPVAEDAIIA
jgi:hypothetical protein